MTTEIVPCCLRWRYVFRSLPTVSTLLQKSFLLSQTLAQRAVGFFLGTRENTSAECCQRLEDMQKTGWLLLIRLPLTPLRLPSQAT